MAAPRGTSRVQRGTSVHAPLLGNANSENPRYGGVTVQREARQMQEVPARPVAVVTKLNIKCDIGMECRLFTALAVLFMFVCLVCILLFIFLPNPIANTTQGVFQGDTVPLYLTDESELPFDLDTYWYKSLTAVFSLDSENEELTFAFAKGSDACIPGPFNGHNTVKHFENDSVTIHDPTTTYVIKQFAYLTLDSTVNINITVDQNPSNAAGLYLYTIKDVDNFYCFMQNNDANDCSHVDWFAVDTTEGVDNEYSYTSTEYGYYFFVLLNNNNNRYTLSYNYTSQFFYFDIDDYIYITYQRIYGPGDVTWELDLAFRHGCIFVSSSVPDDGDEARYIELGVSVTYGEFTTTIPILSVGLLCFVLCLVTLSVYACRYYYKNRVDYI